MSHFSVSARYELDPSHYDLVIGLLKQVRDLTIQEPGCILYEPHSSVDDPSVLFIIERYESEVDFARHMQSEYVQSIVLGAIVPLLKHRAVTKGLPLFEKQMVPAQAAAR